MQAALIGPFGQTILGPASLTFHCSKINLYRSFRPAGQWYNDTY